MEPGPSHIIRSHRPDEFRGNYYDNVGQTPSQMYYSRTEHRSYYLDRPSDYQMASQMASHNNQGQDQVHNQTHNQVPNQGTNQVLDQVLDQVPNQIHHQVHHQAHHQVPNHNLNHNTTPSLPNQFTNQVNTHLHGQLNRQLSSQLTSQLTPHQYRDNQSFSPFVGYPPHNDSQALGLGLQPMEPIQRLETNSNIEINHYHSEFNHNPHPMHQPMLPNLSLNSSHLHPNIDLHPYSPFPIFESPLVGFTSDQSTPARFGSMFPSPWQENEGFDSGTGADETSCQWEGCQEMFSGMDDLIRHVVDSHIGSGRSMYECRWHGCKRDARPFPKRHKMLNHFRTHTGEKPFLCRYPSCKKAFSRPDSLATHIKTHSDVRPYTCVVPSCGRAYYHSRSLRKHLLAHAAKPNPYQDLIHHALEATKPKSKEIHRSV